MLDRRSILEYVGVADKQICEHMAFAAYPPFDGTLQRYYKLYVQS
jgi:hypothetical protein